MAGLQLLRLSAFSAKISLHQFLTGHLKELQPVTFRDRLPLHAFKCLKVSGCLACICDRPFIGRRHQEPPGTNGLGNSSPIDHPSGSFSSFDRIFSNSFGETSMMTEAYGMPLAGAGPKCKGMIP